MIFTKTLRFFLGSFFWFIKLIEEKIRIYRFLLVYTFLNFPVVFCFQNFTNFGAL